MQSSQKQIVSPALTPVCFPLFTRSSTKRPSASVSFIGKVGVPMADTTHAAVISVQEVPGNGVQPNDRDVVLGRGKRYQHHPGNVFFEGMSKDTALDIHAACIGYTLVSHTSFPVLHRPRADLIHRYRFRYFATKKPLDRRAILAEIVDCILRQPGRFVKLNSDSGEWFSISKEDAMNKTARAMQYRGQRPVQAATAGRVTSHERQSLGSGHGHDSPLPRVAAPPTHCIPEDTGTPQASWIPLAALWDPDVLLQQYYMACLVSGHRLQKEPLYRQVSLDMKEDVTAQAVIRPHVYCPSTHHFDTLEDLLPQPAIRAQVCSTLTEHRHHDQALSSHNDWECSTDVKNPIQKEIPTVCKVRRNHCDDTSPVKAFSCLNDQRHLDLHVHDLSAMVDESTHGSSQCGLDDDDWSTSLGSFDSEDEQDQLHPAANMEW
jgi:hypothetical protein